MDIKIEYVEFDLFWNALKALYRKEFSNFTKQFRNLGRLFKFLKGQDDAIVVLGMAPYDPKMQIIEPLLRSYPSVLFNSWTDWRQSNTPYRDPSFRTFASWRMFASRSAFVGVTDACCEQASQMFKSRFTLPHTLSVRNYPFSEGSATKNRSETNVSFIGRLVPEKGIVELCRAVIELEDHFTLDVIGDGPLSKAISEIASTHSCITYHGAVYDNELKSQLLSGADIIALPSSRNKKGWQEVFGIVLIEGMIHGAVPLVTNFPGPREVAIRGAAGRGKVILGATCQDIKQGLLELSRTLNACPWLPEQTAAASRQMFEVSNVAPRWEAVFAAAYQQKRGSSVSEIDFPTKVK